MLVLIKKRDFMKKSFILLTTSFIVISACSTGKFYYIEINYENSVYRGTFFQ
ncbi:MAG: hypothetical protein DDT41_01579 [candidate division WS2 bacterium]|nr:hypothetical protein [Candidatus Psychracetigena formicireducens]